MRINHASPSAIWLYENWELVPLAWGAVIVIFALFHAIAKSDSEKPLTGILKPLETLIYLLFLGIPLLGGFLVSMYGLRNGSIPLAFASMPLIIGAIFLGGLIKRGLQSVFSKLFGRSSDRMAPSGERGSLDGQRPDQ